MSISTTPSPSTVREALDDLENAQIELYATFERPYSQCVLTVRVLRLRQARARYDQIMGIEPSQDLEPTCYYDLGPVTGPPAPVSAPASAVTLAECAALGAVDGAERAVSPVSPFDIARGAVRVLASLARLVRGRRS
jgi:hypothetical protein